MRRILIAIAILAALACSHTKAVVGSQQNQPAVRDSNFVSYDELQTDVQHGHAFLYDALKSTRPYMLLSAGEHGWPTVYVLEPSLKFPEPYAQNPLSPVTDIRQLEKVPTSRVKWIRRYWSLSAPLMYRSETDWSLVVALR